MIPVMLPIMKLSFQKILNSFTALLFILSFLIKMKFVVALILS